MSKSTLKTIVHNCIEKSKNLIQKIEQKENNTISILALHKKSLELEEQIKQIYGNKSGKVKIANAKSLASYIVDKKENEYEWYVQYIKNLHHIL